MRGKEEEILLRLLSGKEVECGCGCDWRLVYRLSVEQGVPALAFDRVRRLADDGVVGLSTEQKLAWYATQCQAERRNAKVNKALHKIVGLLNDANIQSVLLKGQGLAQLYPVPQHRNPGDIDIYVDAGDYERAKEAFEPRGWLNCYTHEDMKHLTFRVDGVPVELHYYAAIVPGWTRNRNFQRMMRTALSGQTPGFFVAEDGKSDGERGVLVRTLPKETNVIYTFAHMFGHFVTGGASLKQLTDWATLIKQLGDTDFDFAGRLKSIGLYKPWQVFGCALALHYGIERKRIPCYDARYERKAELVMDRIFADGKDSHPCEHKIGIKAKCGYLLNMVVGFNRMVRLFPMEYVEYCLQQIVNTARKYANKRHGHLH